MKNKVVLITGGNDGIGKATAIGLATMGANVVIGCRHRDRGLQAVEEIKKAGNNMNVDLLIMDLSTQKSVRNAVADYKNPLPAIACTH
ncbi:MAG: SDR family NAD(P)-dependent oxidoreductase [Chitinophagales bacterium]